MSDLDLDPKGTDCLVLVTKFVEVAVCSSIPRQPRYQGIEVFGVRTIGVGMGGMGMITAAQTTGKKVVESLGGWEWSAGRTPALLSFFLTHSLRHTHKYTQANKHTLTNSKL